MPVHTAFAGSQALWWPCAGITQGPFGAPPGQLRSPARGVEFADPFSFPAPGSASSSSAAASGRPKVVILFIPGNPGVVSFYTQYLSAIYNNHALRGRVEILAVSHRGHASLQHGLMGAGAGGHPFYGPNESQAQAAARGEGTGLLEQIKLKIAAVDAIRAAYPKQPGAKDNVKLLLIGHSIGSYIALEVLKARPELVDSVHLLFPTVSQIGQTPNAKRLAVRRQSGLCLVPALSPPPSHAFPPIPPTSILSTRWYLPLPLPAPAPPLPAA